jgi:NAD(P)-dependent dehydrogenase (short-subunit alcohol dehydrogenase family)|mmetsp:Transcript_51476/g.81650  ORF Transcript_51476/g.81650 Transcript_51476/m.81650 type:complete len:256 (-) Transcript_51476:149-916(-)|eukprot:CAMPEP_0169160538 /NCGR_PEP_ID=MMETSP1015-20121227/56515_1 /TAXON_ID=342587 /ORGANISM="Karlodinium micrum, Strain CCMP2283" /LENGTH=255 /DNA_ID=CAMNT_0009232235 /DNA_START=50 /DNA_END=817 /DNA_ORIENTATION=-
MARAGKTYAITGGAGGLGLATAKLLHSQGANVALLDRDDAGAEVAKGMGARALFCKTDMMEEASVASAIEKAVETFGGLHGIVNCAGTGLAMTTIDKNLKPHASKYFDMIMKLNTYGVFYGSAYAASAMAKCPAAEDGSRGVIINVASVAGYEGQKGQLVYAASKGAVIGMTLPMARDLARYGIRVMTIAPGIMDTPLMQGASPKVKEGLLSQVVGPKRFGNDDEFAQLCATIIDNGYLNGETIRLDGGIRFANL